MQRKCGVISSWGFKVAVLLFAFILISSSSFAAYTYVNQAPQKVAPVIKVPIKTIIVSGNSLLTPQEISGVTKQYEGKDLSFQDSSQVANQITMLYRKHGYFLAYAYVPYQQIVNGVLHINVIEGKLGKVTVEGNKHYTKDFILWNFAPAEEGKTLQYDRLQRQVMLLNEFTDLKVQSVLLPGKDPGTTDVVLKVQDKLPDHLSVDYNNFGTLTGGQNQPNVTFAFGNLIGQGDSLTLNALYPQPNKSISWRTPIVSANYAVPIDNKGLKLTTSYSSSDVRLGQSLDVLNVVGNTNVASIGVSRALVRTDSHSSDFTATFYDKNSVNFTLGAISSTDSIRSVALGYNTNWLSGSGSNLFSATLTNGLGGVLGGSAKGNPQSSTPYASNQFTKLAWNLDRFQSLGSGYMVILKSSGQFALTPLVTAEQFIIGGPESVRGYRTSEQAGDSGEQASIEFRVPLVTRPKSNLQLGLFADAARINNHYSTAGTPGTHHLTGAGVGLRASLGDNTSVRADVGWPLDPKPNSTGERPVFYGEFSTQFI